MKNINRICKTCNKPFKADSREVNRGDARFCSRSCGAKQPKEHIYKKSCKHSGVVFDTASNIALYCSTSCKQKNYRHKSKMSSEEDYVSTRTLSKLFINKGCEICGWNETTCDLHHIIEVSQGGTNKLSNLINVCPNHHRMIHKNLVSKDEILKIAKDRTISSP